jgi:biopolymer transport protein ExbB
MYLILYPLLQAGNTAVTLPTPEVAPSLSVFDLLMKGGLVMIPILLLSVISVYLIIERFMAISNAAKIDSSFMDTIRKHLTAGNVKEAKSYAESTNTALGRIIASGIQYLGYKSTDIENALESSANIEIAKMEQRMSYLGVIAGIAPMLGFIGTISGIIRIFYNISVSNDISIGIIAGGLYEKMITSGTGLIVGVIAYTGYHLLQSRIDKFMLQMQETVQQFKAILYQRV